MWQLCKFGAKNLLCGDKAATAIDAAKIYEFTRPKSCCKNLLKIMQHKFLTIGGQWCR